MRSGASDGDRGSGYGRLLSVIVADSLQEGGKDGMRGVRLFRGLAEFAVGLEGRGHATNRQVVSLHVDTWDVLEGTDWGEVLGGTACVVLAREELAREVLPGSPTRKALPTRYRPPRRVANRCGERLGEVPTSRPASASLDERLQDHAGVPSGYEEQDAGHRDGDERHDASRLGATGEAAIYQRSEVLDYMQRERKRG